MSDITAARRRLNCLAAGIPLLAGVILVTGGCGDRADRPAGESGPGAAITRSASDGPVTVTLSVTPAELEVHSQAKAVLEVTAPSGVTVTIDDYPRLIRSGEGAFGIGVGGEDERDAVPERAGRLVWTHRYKLAFYLAGAHELPGAIVTYVDTRDDTAREADAASADSPEPPAASASGDVPESRTIETEPITVTVIDPAGGELSEADLRNIKVLDPVELRRPWSDWWWAIVIAAVAATLGTWLLMRLRLRRRAIAEAYVLPAHEWAWREIARLVADDLIAKGRVQTFYYRVSDIVRGYIERRFSVSAPEMTTEEFLLASADDERFTQRHRDELSRFLGACDLVKYAKHVPDINEADALLSAAREFVDQTRERSPVEQRSERDAEERAA